MVNPSIFQLVFFTSLVLFDDAGNSVEFVVALDIDQLELFLVVTNTSELSQAALRVQLLILIVSFTP